MSLVRPARRLLSRAQAPLARAASTSTPVAPTSQKPGKELGNLSPKEVANLTRPLMPHYTVARSPDYPNHMKDAPQHRIYNFPNNTFPPLPESEHPIALGENMVAKNMRVLGALTGYTRQELEGLYRYPVDMRRVVNMTKKGKMSSFFSVMVVGDPKRGLVGIGHGKNENAGQANIRAFHQAVLNMDAVPRFENRTLYGQGSDLRVKWRATTVIMRARPPGFGLQVPHVLHRIFSACGIRDASAQILGSTNKTQVVKAALQIIHGGALPPGSGTGKSRARRENKGAGMRTLRELERMRGRHGIDMNRHL
ncbi:hypothetical protein CcaverHIS002_0409790 [Cutaneotrichosporon cavernicola]|uniref:S5 DRBM domain-containing protein n=1 Tax=Cutaneotrichosporon cavernicola TaxID=279322 RepID=A0AA48L541_9TREE|nr:uncharacterized protein CcaverHIS019_0409710 [Cutaneotrichosporon cavernicola]BEI84375.1 hypothetical protein CcaverHIS002_0409790 [Cutaneotrichosporon cavernicola]BEI92151.1 hypothetical protein CcaverHIS019_0409710 [Cutaneotrichosporon cavernicola]BEI99921.1 hypothetical protein CcaverHIS631_0409640 [Cutaneotrichosporon cavernicola]BEJ07696.1 hypothetical protein CcaverHIS641_0409650 [Cutaneotrichosporon cavernicola]